MMRAMMMMMKMRMVIRKRKRRERKVEQVHNKLDLTENHKSASNNEILSTI